MVLIEALEKNIEWYKEKGSKYKKLSFAIRFTYFTLFTAAFICMALFGAGLAAVIFGVLGGAAAMLDRVFNLTRNWIEFSYVEVSLSFSVAAMRHYESKGQDDEALKEFREAVKKIEAETLGWQTDVTQGIREIRDLIKANPSQA